LRRIRENLRVQVAAMKPERKFREVLEEL